jgi:hypothetical protein
MDRPINFLLLRHQVVFLWHQLEAAAAEAAVLSATGRKRLAFLLRTPAQTHPHQSVQRQRGRKRRRAHLSCSCGRCLEPYDATGCPV